MQPNVAHYDRNNNNDYKKVVKAKAVQVTDLLNQYFLFAKNSIKRVNLHLWKAKDNDSTVNKGL